MAAILKQVALVVAACSLFAQALPSRPLDGPGIRVRPPSKKPVLGLASHRRDEGYRESVWDSYADIGHSPRYSPRGLTSLGTSM